MSTDEEKRENYNNLRQTAYDRGIDLFGVCRLDFDPDHYHKDIRAVAKQMTHAISLAVALSPQVFDTIEDGPNDIYKTHYRQANSLLDHASFHLSQKINRLGHKALPIAASFTVDEKMQRGHLSHKQVAELAGLGWRGRNNLLVTKKFGSMVRLATVLTDTPLESDRRAEFECGQCKACIKACPADALGEKVEDYNFDRCYDKLVAYAKRKNFGLLICGHCIKVCKPR
jgi:epoxyqueuosine reductase QueG